MHSVVISSAEVVELVDTLGSGSSSGGGSSSLPFGTRKYKGLQSTSVTPYLVQKSFCQHLQVRSIRIDIL